MRRRAREIAWWSSPKSSPKSPPKLARSRAAAVAAAEAAVRVDTHSEDDGRRRGVERRRVRESVRPSAPCREWQVGLEEEGVVRSVRFERTCHNYWRRRRGDRAGPIRESAPPPRAGGDEHFVFRRETRNEARGGLSREDHEVRRIRVSHGTRNAQNARASSSTLYFRHLEVERRLLVLCHSIALLHKQKQARNRRQSTQHRATGGCAKRSLRISFRKVRQILLRLRQKTSSIEAKEQKLWSCEEGQSISSLESRQAWTRPEPQIA